MFSLKLRMVLFFAVVLGIAGLTENEEDVGD